jgi:hypothetical protein
MALALRFGDVVYTPVPVSSDPRDPAQPPKRAIASGLEGARSSVKF